MNSPPMCQLFVSQALQSVHNEYSDGYIIHYMDDILFACKDKLKLQALFSDAKRALECHGLQIAPEKILPTA